jgi:integrase
LGRGGRLSPPAARSRETEGGRKLSQSFLRAEDARAFDVDIKRRKQLGALAPGIIQSRQTLAEFVVEEWWPRYAIPNLAPDTRRRYLEVWSVHLLPRLGDYELREVTPMAVEDFREQMTRAKVGAPTQRKALMLPQTRIVPAARDGKRPRRAYETSVGSPRDRQRNALIVSMLAYAGLRPIEDRACTWGDLRARTLHVFATKTGRARDVNLIALLAQDLAE